MASKDDQANSFLNSDAVSDDFFITIVENKLKISREKFKLRLVLLSSATGQSENFCSAAYRAKIKIEILESKSRQSVDVIFKALLSELPEIKAFGIFPREMFAYKNVLNSFEKIWLEGAGEEIHFAPKCFKCDTEPFKIIVLDDLKAANYEMMNRKVGLNLEQTKMILTKLAKFHAASAVRFQKDGMIHNHFDRNVSVPALPEDSAFGIGLGKILQAFIKAVKNYGDCDVYAEKIARWDKKQLLRQYHDVNVPMECGFQVMNHGDLWLNNMMFKLDEDGNPKDVLLIDFQLLFWGSPACDLFYFMLTSIADDIKVDHFDNLIKFYHDQLTDGLIKLKYDRKIPSLAELQEDLLKKGFYACVCIMFPMFFVKYDSTEEMTVEILIYGGDEATMDQIYNNENYKKAIKLWLPFLNYKGFLDRMMVQK